MKKMAMILLIGLVVLLLAGQALSQNQDSLRIELESEKQLDKPILSLDIKDDTLWWAGQSGIGWFKKDNFNDGDTLWWSNPFFSLFYDQNTQNVFISNGGGIIKFAPSKVKKHELVATLFGFYDYWKDNQTWYGVGNGYNQNNQIVGVLLKYTPMKFEIILDNLRVNSGRHDIYGYDVGPEAVCVDKQGNIWFGGFDGIYCLKTDGTLLRPDSLNKAWYPGLAYHVIDLHCDKPTNTLFVGVPGSGVNIIDLNNNQRIMVNYTNVPDSLLEPGVSWRDIGCSIFAQFKKYIILGNRSACNSLIFYDLDKKKFVRSCKISGDVTAIKVDTLTNKLYACMVEGMHYVLRQYDIKGTGGTPVIENLIVSDNVLDFGESETEKTLLISRRTDTLNMNWFVACSPWITCEPDNRINEALIKVVVDRTNLPIGIQTGFINVFTEYEQKTIQVRAEINSISDMPTEFVLYQNYPNPFNPTTMISYELPSMEKVSLIIYNLTGQVVEVLIDEQQAPRKYEIIWDASKHPAGIYFYKLQAGGFKQTKKMTLIK